MFVPYEEEQWIDTVKQNKIRGKKTAKSWKE